MWGRGPGFPSSALHVDRLPAVDACPVSTQFFFPFFRAWLNHREATFYQLTDTYYINIIKDQTVIKLSKTHSHTTNRDSFLWEAPRTRSIAFRVFSPSKILTSFLNMRRMCANNAVGWQADCLFRWYTCRSIYDTSYSSGLYVMR